MSLQHIRDSRHSGRIINFRQSVILTCKLKGCRITADKHEGIHHVIVSFFLLKRHQFAVLFFCDTRLLDADIVFPDFVRRIPPVGQRHRQTKPRHSIGWGIVAHRIAVIAYTKDGKLGQSFTDGHLFEQFLRLFINLEKTALRTIILLWRQLAVV